MNRQQLNSQQTRTGQSDLLTLINKVFAVLKVTYPTFLKNADETQTKRLWFTHLEMFSFEKVDQALKDMPDVYPTFPPTVGEFKKLIRDQRQGPLKIELQEICPDCRSTRVTSRHFKMCVEKSEPLETFDPVDQVTARQKLKELFNA